MKQTFIIKLNKKNKTVNGQNVYDFFRVSCKKKETALKYLKGWKQQAIEKGFESLYKCFFCEGAYYEIIETPDGYHETDVVLSGFMKDL